ncbi:hypothetical protein C3L33_14562, partial [Rhododendron williamsianum]
SSDGDRDSVLRRGRNRLLTGPVGAGIPREALVGPEFFRFRSADECNDFLIEEEEGINDHDVVVKCAEIQSAISEGRTSILKDIILPLQLFLCVSVGLWAGLIKGFAIGSAALVSLALFGAFVSRAGISVVNVLSPKVFFGLIVGAMLPYWFSAMTMKSVGSAALKMVEEVRRQFNTIPGLMEGTAKPDYATCVKISTDASIKEMIPPGALVMLTPLIVGTLFGVETLSGVLAGSLVSVGFLNCLCLMVVGVCLTDCNICIQHGWCAWDNAKKYIEAGASEHARTLGPKGSDPHKAAVIGDTIGDPLKDTSGPSLNILIKLMAVESLVFAPFFATHGGLLFKIF